jgi:hypothetical protein
MIGSEVTIVGINAHVVAQPKFYDRAHCDTQSHRYDQTKDSDAWSHW